MMPLSTVRLGMKHVILDIMPTQPIFTPCAMEKRIHRAKIEWRSLSAAPHNIPFMFWEVGWEIPDEYRSQSACRLLLASLENNFPTKDFPINRKLLASILAIRLQAAESQKIFKWLNSTLHKNFDGRFGYPFLDEELGNLCGRHAHRVLDELLEEANKQSTSKDLTDLVERLMGELFALAKTFQPWASSHEVLLEAIKRGIPVKRASSLPSYRLGYGRKQRHLWKGFTDRTSHLATILSTHKRLTLSMLADNGFPIPRHILVKDEEQALHAARIIGYPVVVKPDSTDYGTAVSVGICNPSELCEAFALAQAHGTVLVEQMIKGFDHRLHVIDGRCGYVFKQLPAMVVGNAKDTVKCLIEKQAAERAQHPLYRKYRAASLHDPLVCEMLKKQGITEKSIPRAGEVILLRSNANVSTGGTFQEVTRETHPDNILLAERAAQCIGLDHAGIDFITEDISRSWREIGGGICEINPTPGITLDDTRLELLDYLFPDAGNGHIPIVLIVGSVTDTQHVVEHLKAYLLAQAISTGHIVNRRAFHLSHEITARDTPVRTLLARLLASPDLDFVFAQVDAHELDAYGLDITYCDLVLFFIGPDRIEQIRKSTLSTVGQARRMLYNPSPADIQTELNKCLKEVGAGGAVISRRLA